jgi:Asp-tRNA(Asn)/Glu-tRNA(Gln) amidotransferase A subunit family amidase
MNASRRDLIKAAAYLGALSGLTSCGRATPEQTLSASGAASALPVVIDEALIAAGEKLNGLSFTSGERAMMIEGLQAGLETLAKIRSVDFANGEAPALTFNPKLPREKIRAQKNVVTLGGNYSDAVPASEDDIAFAGVVQQSVWLRQKKISSAALTEIYLKRVEKFDRKLAAFITLTPELARQQALKADDELAKGRDRGPLHGIPYALKDLADTAGVLTTWGAAPYRARIPEADAEIVRKLREAGAVLLGKSACGAIAYGDQWFGGVTKNPWNPGEGSSGSSAGSASATAAGLCSFSIGTETLGSIISPSERCGTTGLRPTFGRVSRAGVMALCWSLDKVGAICRRVEDAAAVLSAINGYDADDPGSARPGFSYDGRMDVKQLTVGYVPEWFEKGDETDRQALKTLKSLGVTLKEFPWPTLDFSPLDWIVIVESAAAFSELTLTGRDDALSWQAPEAWPNTWRTARFHPAVDYVQVDRLRRRLMSEMSVAFKGFDALIGPHYAGGALLATNATGHPQLALRAGYAQTANRDRDDKRASANGVETFRTPRGVSLWGNLFEEGKIIALGRALEEALGVADDRPPGF